HFCFAKVGEIYAVLKQGEEAVALKLDGENATYDVTWYDPRAGGDMQKGSVTEIQGPGEIDLGQPPKDADQDWIVRVKRK
ncbi:MAG: hypothetical protein AAF570_17710, partial [Bacteroidota bacterium]